MSSSYGDHFRMTVFGQSHSPAIGVTIEGIPAGVTLDFERLQRFLNRRAPGNNDWSTARKEKDRPEFISGLRGETTCGTPLTVLIRNTDTRSQDYEELSHVPRPGHADYTAFVKYSGFQDYAGGGHFSGRLTAPLCVAGGICLQLIGREGISVVSRIAQIGTVFDRGELTESTAEKEFPVVDDERGKAMRDLIAEVKADGDSVGGIVECAVLGVPAGLGDPMFDGMENRLAKMLFGIPAVKGLEFGAGFSFAGMRGSESNDAFFLQDEKVVTKTNRCGGILGGITNGMPVRFRVAFKPTPSIAGEQRSVDLRSGKECTVKVHGRHDPCIVVRAVPVVEAAAAVAVYDALLQRRKELG